MADLVKTRTLSAQEVADYVYRALVDIATINRLDSQMSGSELAKKLVTDAYFFEPEESFACSGAELAEALESLLKKGKVVTTGLRAKTVQHPSTDTKDVHIVDPIFKVILPKKDRKKSRS